MNESHYGLRFLLLALIVGANAFFAGAEVSLLTVRKSRLRQLASEGNAGAQAALDLLAKPERLLSVVQFGVTLASLGLGWAGEETIFELIVAAFGDLMSSAAAGVLRGACFVFSFLAMAYAHVVLGEVVPKNLALERADRLAVVVAPVVLIFAKLSSPFVHFLERSSEVISAAFGVTGSQSGGHSAEELKWMVTSSRGAGHLPEAQEAMIHQALDLNEIYVREIMVPRNEIVSVPLDASLDRVLNTMVEHRHSRLPVFDGTPENIIGVLHYKDLLPLWQQRRIAIRARRAAAEFRLSRLIRKHLVVPETKPLGQMLEEFRQGRSHMAMVVDEHGTIAGLLTVEDVLEYLVGEIEDEYDEKTVRPRPLSSMNDIDGATSILDLEARFGVEVPAGPGFETLAGFLLSRLGYIPKAGETVEERGWRFSVLEMEGKRIAKVRIEPVTPT